ncbi:hypothetical protein [Streptomonospora arabica]|uniref:Peptidase S1 domain-containing protein n=1 Tax=Streptomonospora arabica TaxID=412417 RepID=A0ABV9ST88_9ACTN
MHKALPRIVATTALWRVYGEWRVVGVNSRGVGAECGALPDVYTSIGAHDRWITRVIR